MNSVTTLFRTTASMLRKILQTGVLVVATAGVVAAAATTAEPSVPPSHRVIETLLAGGDARAAIAQAQADGTAPKAAAAPRQSRAVAGYARQLQRIGELVTAVQNGASPIALRDALADLRARRELVAARLDAIDRALAERGAVSSRWPHRRADAIAFLARVEAAAHTAERALASLGKSGAVPHAMLAELAELAAANADENRAAVYGANLPVHRPRLPAREPVLAPTVVPAYANAAVEVEPTAADVEPNADAPFSAEILAKADSLGHDYARIVDFVRSEVRTQWYAGAQKGAQGTLRTLAGNDVDQASLLIALLRASRAPARYVEGVLDVPVADLAASLAVRTDKVGQALAAAGVAHKPIARGGRIAAYAIEHVFVAAQLPLSNYRGTSADRDGETWIPLAPALKPHRFVPARGALAATSITARAFADEYVRTVQEATPLDALRDRVSQALIGGAIGDQLAQHALDAPPLELLPTSLPAPTLAITGEFAQLPDRLRQRVRVVVDDGHGGTALDATLPLADVIDRRVTLAYQPASIADGNLADRYGGFGNVPPSLIDVRPVLNVAGLPARQGSGAIENGSRHRVAVTIEGPAGSTAFAQELTAGGLAALVFDAQGDGPAIQADSTSLPGDSETPAARLLANLGARYLATWDAADDELARLVGVGVVRPFPSAVLVINRHAVSRVAGLVDAMLWDGVALDAALRPVEAFAGIADNRAESDWTELSALHGSVLEHRVFEQQWAVDSVSADKGLALAVVQNIPLLQLTSATGVAALNQPQSVKDAIAAWLARGYVVDVPRDPIVHHAWTGAVWRVRALATGESGYFIAGNLAGGATVLPPALWYFQNLVELLGNAYNEPPNDDPLAGVVLTIQRDSQDQDGEAGTVLGKPLRVVVADAGGRPVRGAAVTFSVIRGASKLIGGSGAEVSAVTLTTNARGEADVRLKLDTILGSFGIYRLEQDAAIPQFLGAVEVDVTALARNGRLSAGQPFRAWIKPGPPEKITFGNAEPPKIDVGLGTRPLSVSVVDQYDNEIADADVAVNVSTEFQDVSGICNRPGGEDPPTVDAALAVPGQCPADVMVLTDQGCGTRSLNLKSRSFGAPFHVIPTNAAPATLRVTASAGNASTTLTLTTRDEFNGCGMNDSFRFLRWIYSRSHGTVVWDGTPVDPMDAARPGELIPQPVRGAAFYAWKVYGRYNYYEWFPSEGGRFEFNLQNGSAENAREVAPGIYQFDLRAGSPGPITGDIYLSWEHAHMTFEGPSPEDVHGWVVDPRKPTVTPSSIGLSAFATTETEFRFAAAFEPSNYNASPIRLELLKNGDVQFDCDHRIGNAGTSCTMFRGYAVDPDARYTVRSVLNDETPFRMQSEETPITFGKGVLAGFGILPAHASDTIPGGGGGTGPGGNPLELAALIAGGFPKSLSMNQDIDIPTGFVCAVGTRFGYVLAQSATVTLTFRRLDAAGNPSSLVAWQPLDHVARDAGLHELPIAPADLGPGTFQYTLEAVAADGKVEEHKGIASSNVTRHDALPLAHSLVKGVNVFSGNATLTEPDIVLAGRGPGLKLVRAYASHQGGAEPGYFGRGWSADLDNQVVATTCDERIVTGGAGQGRRFRSAGQDPDGTRRFEATGGYHGTLLQRGADYDYYAKDGTRYHYGERDPAGTRLSYIEDTNGNRVTYTWEFGDGRPRVIRMSDSAGRQIDLTYTRLTVRTIVSGVELDDSVTLVASARGPDGLLVRYEYDTAGNLSKVRRTDDSGKGALQSEYTYHDYGWQAVGQPDGQLTYTRFGHRLTEARDGIAGTARTYAYAMGWSVVPNGDGVWYEPEQRVLELTEPDDGKTQFAYDGVRGGGAVGTTVTDARQNATTYALNRYGAVESMTDPAGTTTTTWNLTAMQPATQTDALGTVTAYTYDDAGNTTSETITHASGTRTRAWTYVPSSDFTAPYVKDRVATFTDARDIATTYGYDARGNRTTERRGGVETTDGYASNGDRTSRTDGRGKIWQYRYDATGQRVEMIDPLRNVVRTRYDHRGRKREETDANGNTTTWQYDARDRVTRVQYPATAAGAAIETTTYADNQRMSRHVNARNVVTETRVDAMGRVLSEQTPIGTVERTYDLNGNTLTETDRGGHVTTFVYDAANRRIEKREPEARTTTFAVDALGHVTRETVGDRVTEYGYDDPAYRRTAVRRKLTTPTGDTWAVESTRYDANGNAIESTDAEGRVVTRTFDDRNRLTHEAAPLGKTTTIAYDGNDNTVSETRANPRGSGTQTRTTAYDDANRPVATTDAEGQTRRQTLDAVGNITAKTDARGNTTRYAYDARKALIEQIGPEAGQRVAYTYDRNGNKATETWANGRALTYTYDALDRLVRTEDEAGVVEARVLDADGLPVEVTDADGRRTITTYNDLHYPKTKRLPGAADRTIRTVISIHGDLETETDARNHATTHGYDTLGRRIRTEYPTVDGVAAAKVMTYDRVGNLTSESNARGQVTHYVVNTLNQRTTQTDPETDGTRYTQHWTYDAQGNVLTHTDRRGILSVTAYDKENRVIGRARDGLILDTRTLDADGNATTIADALGRETRVTYDKANRKVREDRPLGAVELWTYTTENDVASQTDADGRTTTRTYTNRRYLAAESLAGETTNYTTNGSGQRLTRQRPNGTTWTYGYDDAGRLRTVKDPLASITTYGYDAADNRTSMRDANLHDTTFVYDARNRLAGKTYPGGDAIAWTYDADGNTTETRTPLARTIATTYDALSRAVTSTYSSPAPNEPSQSTRRYDGNGNVTTVEETIGTTPRVETRRYDPFDRIEQVTNPLNRRVAYRYDAVGNRTHLTDHDGAETVWSYDALNRNVAVRVPGQGTTTQTHTPAGLLDTVTRPDGSTSTTTYDAAGRIARIAHAKAGAPLATYAYRYDLNGNRSEQKETNGSTTNGEAVTTYRYDDADRLTKVTEPERTTTYTLDAVGNRTVEHVEAGGTPISHSVLTYDARDQLTARTDNVANVHVTQTYDANGNLATQTSNGVTRTYAYDARDRMVSLQEGSATPLTFDYDASGLRLQKTQGPATTRYQYDQASLLAETNAIGNTVTRYHYSAEQLVSTTKVGPTPTQRHYLLDALNSPVVLLTQEGAISSRTRYDAWGEVIAQQGVGGSTITPNRDGATATLPMSDEQPVGFTGYLKDGESGLYYAQARYYDPAVARFTTEDPVAGKDMEPPSLHRYLYAYANPTVYTDPTGRCVDNWCAAGMAYGFARTDEERAVAARAMANANPAIGVMVGAALPLVETGRDIGQLVGAVEPPVLSPEQALSAPRVDAQALYDPVGNYLVGLGESVTRNSRGLTRAIETNDYVGIGQNGMRLAGNATEVAGIAGVARSGAAAMVRSGPATPVRVVESGADQALRLERKVELDRLPEAVEPVNPVLSSKTVLTGAAAKAQESRQLLAAMADDITSYSTPYNSLSANQKAAFTKKLNARSLSKTEWDRLDWDRRIANRRSRGVQRFWADERAIIKAGGDGARNWSDDQIADLLSTPRRTPRFDGAPMEGHHIYNVMDYPHLADKGWNIYPVTRAEHQFRWHGGNFANETAGQPLNPLFEQEF